MEGFHGQHRDTIIQVPDTTLKEKFLKEFTFKNDDIILDKVINNITNLLSNDLIFINRNEYLFFKIFNTIIIIMIFVMYIPVGFFIYLIAKMSFQKNFQRLK